ncbi:MAG: chloramphenicol acetyltransferase [Clostridiales bacterium]|nr:chloramphenicol acetyltransferase [Clostridiales bacterium]
MNYRVIDKDSYYRKGVYRHFTEDCKCSVSMTARIDVTELVEYSGRIGTKFYINFLYILCKVLNSRDDYKMGYFWQTDELVVWDTINPIQYVFHEDTETCTPVYSVYHEDYETFYNAALADVDRAKSSNDYLLDSANHPNWFDASYISWLSYDSMNIELPDGYLFYAPIVNWGRYREEDGRLMMPVTVRLNHAVADGFLIANVYRLLDREITFFCG